MEAGSNVCVRKGQNSENGVTFFTPLSLFFTSRLFLLAKKQVGFRRQKQEY